MNSQETTYVETVRVAAIDRQNAQWVYRILFISHRNDVARCSQNRILDNMTPPLVNLYASTQMLANGFDRNLLIWRGEGMDCSQKQYEYIFWTFEEYLLEETAHD